MGDARRKAQAFALELAGAWPSAQITKDTIDAYAAALADVGLDVADDVSSLLRVRSTSPPSVAQIYEAGREVRKETMSPTFDPFKCIFVDGVRCPNCGDPRDPESWGVHGHLIAAGEMFHGAYHLGRHQAGIAGEFERAKQP